MENINNKQSFVDIFFYHKGSTESDLQDLSKEEEKKSKRFINSQDSERYTFAHIVLRKKIAEYIQCKPKEVEFIAGLWGKPELKPGSKILHFNLSYRADWVMLGISDNSIGVDIEKITLYNNLDNLVSQFFNSHEREIYYCTSFELKPETFYDIWTSKEAFLKANGIGLLADDLKLEEDNILIKTDWHVEKVDPPEIGYCASVCCKTTLYNKPRIFIN